MAATPKFLTATPVNATTIQLDWQPVENVDYLTEISSTADPTGKRVALNTNRRVGGLATHHQYGFRVLAVDDDGTITPASNKAYASPTPPATVDLPLVAAELPLEPLGRQSFTARINENDVLIRVWWQPDHQAWFGSVESPPNTPIVQGRRLVVNSGMLAGASDALDGDVVVRAASAQHAAADPGPRAWAERTHILLYEPNSLRG